MLLASHTHTVGDRKRWRVEYRKWLANSATLVSAVVTSSSITCTVSDKSILGTEVVFFLNGGVLNEVLTVSVQVTDSLGMVKNDTISFTVVAP